jgi:hypothetical protein
MISLHAGQRMNRRLLRLPLLAPGRMQKNIYVEKQKRCWECDSYKKKFRPQRNAGEPAHGSTNLVKSEYPPRCYCRS